MSDAVAARRAVPVRWTVNELELAGLSWGEPGERPLLALHGWLDNAASFSCLAPLLSGFHVVALDLTGHGLSAWRSADASYQIWDDLPEILGVLDALGWDTFDLLGHSRGAIIASLLASAFGERVQHLVMLDAVAPKPVLQEQFPVQLRTALLDTPKMRSRPPRIYAGLEQAIASRQERGLPPAAARLLVERNINTSAQGVTWSTDPRLHAASAVKLTVAQIEAVLGALSMPALLLLSNQSSDYLADMVERAQRHIADLSVQVVRGGHHFHMESDVKTVAQYICQFLSTTRNRETA